MVGVSDPERLHEMVVDYVSRLGLHGDILQGVQRALKSVPDGVMESCPLLELFRFARYGTVQVAATDLNGTCHCRLTLDACTSVGVLRSAVQAETHIPLQNLKLVHRCRHMLDGELLAEHNISPLDNSVMVVECRPQKLYMLGGASRDLALGRVEVFDPSAEYWAPLPAMSSPRSCFAAVAMDRRIYVVGGESAMVAFATCEMYDIDDMRWTPLPPMQSRRTGCAAAGELGKVYVMGGCGGGDIHASVEMLDVSTGAWQMMPPMARPRERCAAAVIDGGLYVVGGSTGSHRMTPTPSLEVLSLSERCTEEFDYYSTERWTELPAMAKPRYSCGAVGLDSKLYVVGGRESMLVSGLLSTGEVFDTTTRTWESLPPMGLVRYGGAVTAQGGKIFVLGGCDNDPRGECFDTMKQVWTWLPPMTIPRTHSAVVTA